MSDTPVYLECGEGWRGLIDPVLALAAEKGIRVLQVKQKWGRLRIYVARVDAELDTAIALAEHMSGHVCETCGAPGEKRTTDGGYWVETRCHAHAEARR